MNERGMTVTRDGVKVVVSVLGELDVVELAREVLLAWLYDNSDEGISVRVLGALQALSDYIKPYKEGRL